MLVGGPTANQVDFVSTPSSKLPLFIAVVVLLAALLLMVVFRSVVIPVQAAVMNLLSFAASLGVVVAIFQWAGSGGLLGVTGGPIDAFIPVFLDAFVVGVLLRRCCSRGRTTWRLPDWLDRRLPHLAIDGQLADRRRADGYGPPAFDEAG